MLVTLVTQVLPLAYLMEMCQVQIEKKKRGNFPLNSAAETVHSLHSSKVSHYASQYVSEGN